MTARQTISRRELGGAMLAALVGMPRLASAEVAPRGRSTPQATEGQAEDPGLAAPLEYPGVAGRDRERIAAYDNDPFVIELEERLKCNCGCQHSVYVCRTTDFNCGYWQALHAEIVSMVEQNMTADEIVAAYVANHGEQYLMAPPPAGFNLAGYLVPGFLIAAVGSGLLWLLARRHQVLAVAVAPEPSEYGDLSPEDVARLEAELRAFED